MLIISAQEFRRTTLAPIRALVLDMHVTWAWFECLMVCAEAKHVVECGSKAFNLAPAYFRGAGGRLRRLRVVESDDEEPPPPRRKRKAKTVAFATVSGASQKIMRMFMDWSCLALLFYLHFLA